jgi:hypothetical protein
MDTYTIQQIMERCLRVKYLNVEEIFGDVNGMEKTIRMKIIELYGWCEDTCQKISRYGHLECLRYAHENGCQWDIFTCYYASLFGHLECLKYAHENGCPWDEDTCSGASSDGHLECLKYVHENGCPWDKSACFNASVVGQLECLKYAHENGCPIDIKTCLRDRKTKGKCRKYLVTWLNKHLYN